MSYPRDPLHDAIRQRALERAGNRCEYCRMPQQFDELPFEIEHVIAKQHGGIDRLGNRAPPALRVGSGSTRGLPAAASARRVRESLPSPPRLSGPLSRLPLHRGPFPFKDLAQEPIVLTQAALDLARRSHNEIERELPLEGETNADRLIDDVDRRHDHQQIHVTFDVGLSIGV